MNAETALIILGAGNLAPWVMFLTGKWRVSTRPERKASPVRVVLPGVVEQQTASADRVRGVA